MNRVGDNAGGGGAGVEGWRGADVTFCGHNSGMSGCSRYVGEGQVALHNLFFFLFTPLCQFLSPSSVSIGLRLRWFLIPAFQVFLSSTQRFLNAAGNSHGKVKKRSLTRKMTSPKACSS